MLAYCDDSSENVPLVCDTAATTAGPMAAGSNATITDEMYRASLLSAVEDKIRRRLREVFDQAQVTCLSTAITLAPSSLQCVGLNQRSYAAPGSVNTWMGDRLRAGKPSHCVP